MHDRHPYYHRLTSNYRSLFPSEYPSFKDCATDWPCSLDSPQCCLIFQGRTHCDGLSSTLWLETAWAAGRPADICRRKSGRRLGTGCHHRPMRWASQLFRRNISERTNDYPAFNEEFVHLVWDTIVGVRHQSAVITLIARLSKVIITLKFEGRTAQTIEAAINTRCYQIPKNIFKSITFAYGKDFSNWQSMSNRNDLAIYFADPGTPSQQGLNEYFNGLLRKGELPKNMVFNTVNQIFVSSVAARRNHIPRKSLNYRTPLEVFLSYMVEKELFSLF